VFWSGCHVGSRCQARLLAKKAMSQAAILDQKHSRGTPPQGSTVLSTNKTVYGYSVIHSAICLCPLPCVLKELSRE